MFMQLQQNHHEIRQNMNDPERENSSDALHVMAAINPIFGAQKSPQMRNHKNMIMNLETIDGYVPVAQKLLEIKSHRSNDNEETRKDTSLSKHYMKNLQDFQNNYFHNWKKYIFM
ncbi:hypothetical protein L9F63_025566, partial [Diploptera punctata]